MKQDAETSKGGSPLILEFGSQSLKVHYQSRRSGVFRKARFAWDLGHEVYSTGEISRRTLQKAVETINELRTRGFHPRNLLAIATGALRDATNRSTFIKALEAQLGTEIRVITGREEASLLAQGYLAKNDDLPALVVDIGGGSLELVYLGADKSILRDSLPLGAIRLYHFGFNRSLELLEPQDGGGSEDPTGDGEGSADPVWDESLAEAYIDSSLADATVMTAAKIWGTGGTCKAIAKTLGKPTATHEDLAALLTYMREKGPPADLRDDRKLVFHPGVLILYKLLEHSGARELEYLKIPAGRIFLQRLTNRMGTSRTEERKRFLMRDLRITNIHLGKDPLEREDALDSRVLSPSEAAAMSPSEAAAMSPTEATAMSPTETTAMESGADESTAREADDKKGRDDNSKCGERNAESDEGLQ